MPAKRRGSGTPSRRRASRAPQQEEADVPSSAAAAAFASQRALVSQYLESLVTDDGRGIPTAASASDKATKRPREAADGDVEAAGEGSSTHAANVALVEAALRGEGAAHQHNNSSGGPLLLSVKDRVREGCRVLTRLVRRSLDEAAAANAAAADALEDSLVTNDFMVLKQMADDFAEGVALWSEQARAVVAGLREEQSALRGFTEATERSLSARRERFEAECAARGEQMEVDILRILADSEQALADVLPPESRRASVSLARHEQQQQQQQQQRFSERQHQQQHQQSVIGTEEYDPVRRSGVTAVSAVNGPSTPEHASTATAAHGGGSTCLPPAVLHTAPRSNAPSVRRRYDGDGGDSDEGGNGSRRPPPRAAEPSSSYSLQRPSPTSTAAGSRGGPTAAASAAASHHSLSNGRRSPVPRTYPGAQERRFASLHPTSATTSQARTYANNNQQQQHSQNVSPTASMGRTYPQQHQQQHGQQRQRSVRGGGRQGTPSTTSPRHAARGVSSRQPAGATQAPPPAAPHQHNMNANGRGGGSRSPQQAASAEGSTTAAAQRTRSVNKSLSMVAARSASRLAISAGNTAAAGGFPHNSTTISPSVRQPKSVSQQQQNFYQQQQSSANAALSDADADEEEGLLHAGTYTQRSSSQRRQQQHQQQQQNNFSAGAKSSGNSFFSKATTASEQQQQHHRAATSASASSLTDGLFGGGRSGGGGGQRSTSASMSFAPHQQQQQQQHHHHGASAVVNMRGAAGEVARPLLSRFDEAADLSSGMGKRRAIGREDLFDE